MQRPFSLNINGNLLVYRQPAVMGILNVTPDSFHAASRACDAKNISRKVEEMVRQGADIIDIGAYSTRPGCQEVSVAEELRRVELGMEALRRVAPSIPVSLDTFRPEVARHAVKSLGVNIINDISGGAMSDMVMLETVADLHVPYILMHMRGTPHEMTQLTDYDDLLCDMIAELAEPMRRLESLGVCDVILDPGFGFSKTMEQNYMILKHLNIFEIFHLPILVGISRKSMITQLLDVSAEQALQGTTALNMYALQQGASILRVHDVEPAVQAVKLYQELSRNTL